MSHQNKLEVTVGKDESLGYSVTVSWQGRRESSQFAIPYLQNLGSIIELVSKLDDDKRRPRASDDQLREVGLVLYNSLFPKGKIRDLVLSGLASTNESIELELKYKDPEIGKIPWELLHDGRISLKKSM
ncbi:MAG: hypothetical protein NTX81_07350 [Candidatus Bathyarchaeota archaeon]|nr:hypothetical protein [Candidatus Bathyarchaeota archaeon]